MIINIKYPCLILIFIFLISSAHCLYASLVIKQTPLDNSTSFISTTFFRPRSFSQNAVLSLGLINYEHYHALKLYKKDTQEANPISLDIMGMYYNSTKGESLARYFFIQAKTDLTIGADNFSDISAPWLQIVQPGVPDAQFKSVMQIRPERKVVGGAFNLFIDIGHYLNTVDKRLRNFWFNFFMPVIHVRHDMHFEENIIVPASPVGPGGISNAKEAFNNPSWQYGKIPTCTKSKTGVDDIQAKLGYDLIRNYFNHFGLYGVLFIPTGHKSKSEFLFEPTMGSGSHPGLGGGIDGEYNWWHGTADSISILADVRYTYFFKSHERRVYDLFFNGDWSRYLLITNGKDLNTPLPLVNFANQDLMVAPRHSFEIWTAIHYEYNNFNLEFGYDFWWRNMELVTGCFNLPFYIFDLVDLPPNRTTISTATINSGIFTAGSLGNPPDPDLVPTVTAANDCDEQDAGNPKARTQTFYLATSYTIKKDKSPLAIIAAGVSYESSFGPDALSQWGVWLRATLNW